MITANTRVPLPTNEPVLSYAPGTAERAQLKAALSVLGAEKPDIPLLIGGAEVRTGKTFEVRSPHRHSQYGDYSRRRNCFAATALPGEAAQVLALFL